MIEVLQRHRVAAAIVTVCVIAAAAIFVPRAVLGPHIDVEAVVQRDFTQTVVASGRVETPHRIDVGVQIVGTVADIPVEEGQSVTADTVLIRLRSDELQAAVSQADLAVREAQARVRQVRELDEPSAEQSVRQAQANYDMAARTLQRNRDLFAKEFIGQAALDDVIRAEQVAQAQLRTAEQQHASAKAGGSAAATADAALQEAQAAAVAARARLAYAQVTAPVAGTLIARDVERGDVVQPGKALMVLSPQGEAQLVVQIDEKNLKLLQLGQPALASADAYAEQRFPARIVYINPGVDAQRGAVEVKLTVPQPPPYLKQDMTVSVDIEVARRAQAVLVPTDAVHDADSRAPWVLKVEDGHARRQAVTLGLRSGSWCEVVQGLKDGDDVVPAAGTDSSLAIDGARIRPVERVAK